MRTFRDIASRWLYPPVFEDEDRTYAARMLYALLGFALGNSLLVFSRALAQPELTIRVLGFGSFSLVFSLGLLALTRTGRTRLVSWLAVVVFWFFIHVASVTAGGLQANTLMGLFVLTVFTGLLFGIRGGLTMAGVNILAVFAHTLAESQGWLRTPKIVIVPTVLALEAAYQMVTVAALVAVATRSLRDALNRARREVEERRRSEQALLQSEENYRTVFNATSDALIVYDLEAGRPIDVNLAMLKLYGLASKEEALACSAAELSANEPPYTRAEGQRHLQRAIENGLETYEWRARKKTGEPFWAEIATRCFEMNGRYRLIASIRDLTERKRNEEELRRSEGRLDAAQAQARIGSWELNADLTSAIWSRQMFRLFNLDPASRPWSAHEFMELIHPADRDAISRAHEQALRSVDMVSIEYRTNPARGPVRVLSASIVARRDAAGRVLHTAGTVQDVTERRLTEESLKESEEAFRSLFEAGPVAAALLVNRKFQRVNSLLTQLSGYSEAEMLGQSPRLQYPDDAEFERVGRELNGAVEREGFGAVEARTRRKDGELRDVLFCARPLDSRNLAKGMVVTGLDITERKRAEEALRASAMRARRQRAAIAELVLGAPAGEGVLPMALDQVTKKLAETLGVERTGVWMLSEDDAELRCQSLFEASKNLHTSGTVLKTANFSTYLQAIRAQNRTTVSDAVTDPRTTAIGAAYLEKLGITSSLAAGIQAGGKLVGVVSAEHVGAARAWHPDEEAFVSTTAAVVAQMLTHTEQKRAEQVVRRLSELGRQLGSVSSAFAAAQAVVDAADELLGWDACFVKLRFSGGTGASYILSMDLVDGKRQSVVDDTAREVTAIERRVMEQGAQLILREHPGSEPGFVRFGDRSQPSASLMYVPLRTQENHLGLFSIQSYKPHAYTQASLDLLQTLADYAAGALERIHAEEAFRDSEDRYGLLVNSLKDILYSISTDGKVQYISPQVRAYGFSETEMIGEDFLPFVLAEDRPSLLRDFQHTATTGQETQCTFRFRSKDGRLCWFEEIGRAVCDKAGNIIAVTGMLRDVTDRKRAEERIRQQAALLDVSHDAVMVWDVEDGIQLMNPAAQELTGMTLSQAHAQPLSAVLHPRAEVALEVASQEVTIKGNWSGELMLLAANGKQRVVASRWTLLPDAEGKATSVLITCNDITEKKQLESQSLRSQRLESVGTLASGVAHDLNNILSPVLMGIELLGTESLDEETLGILNMMKESTRRGVDTVKQLLTFARGAEAQKGPVQPRHLLKEIVRLVQQTFPKNIQVYTEYSGEPATVLADPSQLHQVLMNLCVNARDAMPEGGVLFIRLENSTLGEEVAKVHPKARPQSYVVFKITDSGTGIPPEILDRIFDPFFTTKPQGQGTGLGLATVLGIVEDHGGFVLVDSRLGKGTTFQVFLPASTATERVVGDDERAAPPRGSGELVLLVDDEPAILHLASEILRHGGYATITASNASEALHLYERSHERIRAVLTDIMMPFGDGRQLITMLYEQNPQLPIIAMSGLATREFQQETLMRGARDFIRKPFTAAGLLKLLSDVLASFSRDSRNECIRSRPVEGVKDPAQRANATAPPVVECARSSASILLVDDDKEARQTVGQVLRIMGHCVYEAADAQEALAVWQTHKAEVALLLTEMFLPGNITGLMLSNQLQAWKPGLKVIITSSNTSVIAQSGSSPKPGVFLLPKPYQVGTLADMLRNCLIENAPDCQP